jgi:hypothetical protein
MCARLAIPGCSLMSCRRAAVMTRRCVLGTAVAAVADVYMCSFLCHLAPQFDELQTCSGDDAPLRRPPCESLLDVFMNIRDDEVEHVKTMHACQVRSVLTAWLMR